MYPPNDQVTDELGATLRTAHRRSRYRPGMTAFHELDDYLALPRVTSLTMSPDGNRLVITQSTLDDKATSYTEALWRWIPKATPRRAASPTAPR